MTVSTLVATAGASNANTYCTLAVANQYHEDRAPQDSNWSAADDDDKNRALLRATELLDVLFEWTGCVVDYDQALLWPRNGMWDRNGDYIESDVIPEELQRATAEFAGQLLAADRVADSDIETNKVKAFRVGPISFQFGDGVEAKAVPDAVFYMIPSEWYSSISGRTSGVRNLVRA